LAADDARNAKAGNKYAKPAAVHETVMFDLDNPDWAVFDAFHDKLKDAIKRSPEFAKVAGHSSGQTPTGGFDDMPDF
jgi:hypothetical protein